MPQIIPEISRAMAEDFSYMEDGQARRFSSPEDFKCGKPTYFSKLQRWAKARGFKIKTRGVFSVKQKHFDAQFKK